MSDEPEAFGPYLVYEELGVGGMAQVHRAEVVGIEGFKRPVALKRMLEHVAMNEDLVAAFVREARLASYMRHRNIAQTYDLGKVGDIYFIAMELIEGYTLREVLKHCGQTTGPMPVPVALNILNQICDALDYAHDLTDDTGQPLGIIHRDVSPSNIIVAEGGCVKLIDFGIAKASAAGMQTMSGTIKGKFGYMAPEYIGGSIDARADLFAVGVIAHELLTNRPLFSGPDDMDTLNRVLEMKILPPSRSNPNVPVEIDEVVMTALERDPEKRWQHAAALRSALTTLTRRLGLVVQDAHVTEWISWALDQTKPRQPSLRVRAVSPISAISMDAVTPLTKIDAVASRRAVEPAVAMPPASSTVQPSETLQVDERQIRVEAYVRHDAPHPAANRPANDDLAATLVRAPSAPRNDEPQRLAPPRPPGRVPKQTSPVVAVLLVLFVAGVAAAVVYFAL